MIKFESLKITVLGFVLLFFSKSSFFSLRKKCFGELNEPEDTAKILRSRFWKSFLLLIVFISLILAIQQIFFNAHFTTRHWFQATGVFISLTGALGRGGWDIQTCSGKTIVERIDRGMYVISQLGATTILLFILIF